jgi:hypothetical protein
MNKKELGKFYTTNYKYIFQNLIIPFSDVNLNIKTIIEPFAGNCDLINFIEEKNIDIELYDIDNVNINNVNKNIIIRDTLLNPPSYKEKFVLTNPPFLARNKSTNKDIFNKYNTNDLYKCFIKTIINDPPIGGIIILPINFITSIRKNDIELRKDFIHLFNIIDINIFENRVFDDTSSSICSFLFLRTNNTKITRFNIYKDSIKTSFNINLNENNLYMPYGEIYLINNNIHNKKYKVSRWINSKINKNNTQILVSCIDGKNESNKISMSFNDNNDDLIKYCDDTANKSARSYMVLDVVPNIDIEKQNQLINSFNDYLNNLRNKYKSLFLPAYREYNRKRISFDLVYKIVEFLLVDM